MGCTVESKEFFLMLVIPPIFEGLTFIAAMRVFEESRVTFQY
jgi:hypothetical protein